MAGRLLVWHFHWYNYLICIASYISVVIQMTTPNIQQLALAKVDAEIERILWRVTTLTRKVNNYEGNEQNHIRERAKLVKESTFIRALRSVIVKTSVNGYTTWDKSMVPMVDGVYDFEETYKWELHHGHDIRLKCYAEYGCQLLIDPSELMDEIAKELKV